MFKTSVNAWFSFLFLFYSLSLPSSCPCPIFPYSPAPSFCILSLSDVVASGIVGSQTLFVYVVLTGCDRIGLFIPFCFFLPPFFLLLLFSCLPVCHGVTLIASIQPLCESSNLSSSEQMDRSPSIAESVNNASFPLPAQTKRRILSAIKVTTQVEEESEEIRGRRNNGDKQAFFIEKLESEAGSRTSATTATELSHGTAVNTTSFSDTRIPSVKMAKGPPLIPGAPLSHNIGAPTDHSVPKSRSPSPAPPPILPQRTNKDGKTPPSAVSSKATQPLRSAAVAAANKTRKLMGAKSNQILPGTLFPSFPFCPSARPSVRPSVRLSACLPACLSVRVRRIWFRKSSDQR